MANFKLISERLIDDITNYISNSDTIYLLVSFVMESGVRLLVPYLRDAANRGADIKILTGDYLYVTQPQGLQLISSLDSRIEVRLWHSQGVSFHPKAYLLANEAGESVMIVGSSNLSQSALTHGVEWNLKVGSSTPIEVFDEAQERFMALFYSDNTEPVNPESVKQYLEEYETYHRRNPNLAKTWTVAEEMGAMFATPETPEKAREINQHAYRTNVDPRPVQIEALKELANVREEGYDKALVVMATGLGKTFLAALFATSFKRVLFIAHREEILHQAKHAFETVLPNRSCGLYYGQEKNIEADCIFASITTLGMQRHRTRFSAYDFDLIIIDEFHHAAAMSYQKVIDYFQPEFLLGITATPDRADGRDVYAICDGNVAYKIDFIEAIQRGWLSPFHYVGVYDETDYSQIRWLGSRYDEQELLAVQLKDSLASNIHRAWESNRQSRSLGFCSSIAQANYLSAYFTKQGVRSVSLHSKTTGYTRAEAIRQLSTGELEIIFTVDLFNEGVDIPSVDTLLFVRPTESLTVFTQQIGRGLRLHDGKSNCTIIDLIGNYRNADVKLAVFNVEQATASGNTNVIPIVPDTCSIDLDTRVINLLQEMRRKRQPRREILRESYFQVKRDLGRRPTYEELHLLGPADSRGYKQEFGSYIGFLNWADELDSFETGVFHRYESWFREVESTVMTKSYKMVLLLTMLTRGLKDWHKLITPEEVAPFFHHYFMEKEYRKRIDFSDKETKRLWTYDEETVAKLIAKMPMTMWSGRSKGLVTFDGQSFTTLFLIEQGDEELVYEWTRQICDYRLHWHFERKGHSVKGEKARDFVPFRLQ